MLCPVGACRVLTERAAEGQAQRKASRPAPQSLLGLPIDLPMSEQQPAATRLLSVLPLVDALLSVLPLLDGAALSMPGACRCELRRWVGCSG